jgi:hypothetical protein
MSDRENKPSAHSIARSFVVEVCCCYLMFLKSVPVCECKQMSIASRSYQSSVEERADGNVVIKSELAHHFLLPCSRWIGYVFNVCKRTGTNKQTNK